MGGISPLAERRQYKQPPIDEVLCDVRLAPLDAWRVIHIGAFWATMREHFPKCEHAPPLDIGSPENTDAATQGLPLPRAWLISLDDAQVLQLQRNRFIFNWRRRAEGQPYIGFEAFQRHLLDYLFRYRDFLLSLGIGPVVPVRFELAYIDVFPKGMGWDASVTDVDRILPVLTGLSGLNLRERISGVELALSMDIQELGGTITVKMNPAVRSTTNEPAYRLEIRAHGMLGNPALDALEAWTNLAHDHITNVFNDITSEYARKELWQSLDASRS